MKIVFCAGATALALLAGPVHAADGPPPSTTNPPQSAAGAMSADGSFMTKAAGAGLYEVEVSKLAQDRADAAEVKKFAEMLVSHHTAANGELKALAQARSVDLPGELPSDKKARIDSLSKLSGADFDKAFVQKVGIDDHQSDIALFKRTANSTGDAEVKAFAEKTLPVLEQHLQRAQAIARAQKK